MKETIKSERNIVLSASAATESGNHLAEGNFTLKRTDTALTSTDFGTAGHGGGDPSPKYMLLYYMSHCDTHLFKFPIGIGETWTEEGHWRVQTKSRLEGYESVEVSAGTFPDCLKHKTVFTDADVKDTKTELRNALLNGTRYLWFAEGVGLVKLRYEHSNGVVTEAELLEYKIPVEDPEYLPLQIGNVWTYKWQNTYRAEAAIEEWRVIRNFSEPENLDTAMELASARYEVKIDSHDRRVANVACVLTPKTDKSAKGDRKPLLLSMSHFGTDGMYDGYGRYLRDLTATDTDGEKIPVTEIGKTQWMVEVENDLPVTLRYKVLLNHDEREWAFGRDEAPYVQEDCIFCPGYALFIVGEVADIELRVAVPDDWHVSTPWNRIGNERDRFAITDQNGLMYAYLVLGKHSERMAESEGTEVLLALGGHFKASMDEVQRTVKSLLDTYSEIFGGTPRERMLFVANPCDIYSGGGVSGRSISVLMDGTLDANNRQSWTPLVAHEICHIWNGKAINFSEQEYWFSEGFTEYASKISCARLGIISEEDFLKDLERKCELYLSKQGELSIREAGENKMPNRGLVYEGGSLIAAALDLQIREHTQNRKSLDDVMKQMYQEFGLTGNEYTMNDVIRIVSQIADEDFELFFKKYVSGTERLPLADYFTNAGINVKIAFGEKLPSLGYILFQMLEIKSIGGSTGGGMFIHQSPQYQDDDNLIGINGTPVKFFDDIRKVAKDWKPGDMVELTVERESENVTIPITLGGDPSESPPLEPGPIDVTITKKVDSTEPQRAIWSGMLGNGNPPQVEIL
ncbi:MAG: M1 family aminopeptidase [Candidatus Poribacteria bacterium]|nr:M1 family aminopeptidase [Candidatus Poribacteria bacterium]